jgi:sodium-dependent dicarboxylate transporter 2/3/5
LILFGGGLSLAAAVSDSGLSLWFGEQLAGLGGWSLPLLTLSVVGVVILLTELSSNMATTAILLPLIAALAVANGYHPLLLAAPATVAASCAFMLPVATPPNAIVFGSGRLTIPQMSKAGIWINLTALVLVALVVQWRVIQVFEINPG